jgi:hypothetical protein
MPTPSTLKHLLWLLIWALCAASAWALEPPKGTVVLTLSGAIGITNSNGNADFDMEMLKALPQKSFTTKTPWHPNPVKFTGPLLRDVLAHVKATGSSLTASALDNYKTTIPVSDASKYDVIIARLMNDKPMAVRAKGPLFIIYPFDDQPEVRDQVHYGRSAWQLRSIAVE